MKANPDRIVKLMKCPCPITAVYWDPEEIPEEVVRCRVDLIALTEDGMGGDEIFSIIRYVELGKNGGGEFCDESSNFLGIEKGQNREEWSHEIKSMKDLRERSRKRNAIKSREDAFIHARASEAGSA